MTGDLLPGDLVRVDGRHSLVISLVRTSLGGFISPMMGTGRSGSDTVPTGALITILETSRASSRGAITEVVRVIYEGRIIILYRHEVELVDDAR